MADRRRLVTVCQVGLVGLVGLLTVAVPVQARGDGSTSTGTGPLVDFAGGGTRTTGIDDVSARAVALGTPIALAATAAGGLYIGEWEGRVLKVDPDGVVTTVADGGDGLASVGGIAVADDGSLYVSDPAAHRVATVAPDGTVTTVAGTGHEGTSGDGGPATDARLRSPEGLAIGADGSLYIADPAAHRVATVAPDGTITTVAGTGHEGTSGDGGPATDARLRRPRYLAAGPDGSLYVTGAPRYRPGSSAAEEAARIRRVDPAGRISTVAGGGSCGPDHDDGRPGGPALCAAVPDIAVDTDGVVYFYHRASDAIWTVTPGGVFARLPVYVDSLFSFTVSEDRVLFVSTEREDEPHDNVVRRTALSVPLPPPPTVATTTRWDDLPAGSLAPAAGTGEPGYTGDGGPATLARLSGPGSITAGRSGVVYVVDSRNGPRIRSIDPDGVITTYAGRGRGSVLTPQRPGPAPGDGRPATEVSFHPLAEPVVGPAGGVTAAPDGSVYLTDAPSHRVFRVNPLGTVTTVAGTGEQGYAGDGGPAVDAVLDQPADVAVAPDGSVYVADHGNGRVRRIGPHGTISTVAQLDRPWAVSVGRDGTVHVVADHQLWMIEPGGAVTGVPVADPVAGSGGAAGPGDPAVTDVAVGPDGSLYVAAGTRVLTVDPDTGAADVVAGTGEVGAPVDDPEPAADTALPVVDAVALDPAGNLYLSHTGAHRVQVVTGVVAQPGGPPWWLPAAVTLAAGAVVAGLVAGVVRWRRRRRA